MKNLQLILNIALLVIALFFGYKWFYEGNGASKERIKILEKELKELREKKKDNDALLSYWKNKFDSLRVEDSKLQAQIIILEKNVAAAESEATASRKKLEALRSELIAIRKKIEQFKKNPPNREDDELLTSLKNKLK